MIIRIMPFRNFIGLDSSKNLFDLVTTHFLYLSKIKSLKYLKELSIKIKNQQNILNNIILKKLA